MANSWTVLCSLHYFHILRQQPVCMRRRKQEKKIVSLSLNDWFVVFNHIYLVIVHIQIVRCWEYCYKRWKTSCETLTIHSIPARGDTWKQLSFDYRSLLTQHLELHEHEWWIANCCFAKNHNTLGSCRSKSNHERYYVNRNRCFSHCRNLPTDRTTISRTLAHMLAVLCSDRVFEYHPSPEFRARDRRARTKIAGSLMQLMANNRKHPCTHRKHVLNI